MEWSGGKDSVVALHELVIRDGCYYADWLPEELPASDAHLMKLIPPL
jgi:hypothetical protein